MKTLAYACFRGKFGILIITLTLAVIVTLLPHELRRNTDSCCKSLLIPDWVKAY